MGFLVEGVWRSDEARRSDSTGRFVRPQSPFRDFVRADGSSRFPAEPGRYHLYVNRGCPWAYRALLYRSLKKLEDVISLSATAPGKGAEGWHFAEGPGCIPDPVLGARHLHQIYTAARPDFTGRVTVPVLWDKKLGTIVNNESADIMRIFNCEFDAWGDASLDFYPEDLRDDIDALNETIYTNVNNGVYRCGFAASQEAYEEAYDTLFATLDDLNERLRTRRFLFGDRITESDWRLFSTLIRFDLAYYSVFRTNMRHIFDYTHLWPYTRDLYQWPRVAGTVDFEHIKAIYYSQVLGGLIPKGPKIDFSRPHDRARLSGN